MLRTGFFLLFLLVPSLLMAQTGPDFVGGRIILNPRNCGDGVANGNEICYTYPLVVDHLDSTGQRFGQLVSGLFNNDGLVDFAVTTEIFGQDIRVYQQNAVDFTPVAFSGGDAPSALGLGDLNQDGQADLATGVGNGVGAIFFGENNATMFQWDADYNVVPFARNVKIGDVTGDGINDLVVAGNINPNQGLIEIYEQDPLNPGTMQFSNSFVVDARETPMVLADMDKDGTREIVFGSLTGVGVLFVSGSHKSGVPVYSNFGVPTNFPGVKELVVDFLDNGMVRDVIVMFSDYLARAIGHTNGTFNGSAFHKTTSNNNSAMTLSDTNNDGAPDLIVGDEDSINIYINQDNGFADYYPGQSFTWNALNVSSILSADINSDGFEDLLFVSQNLMGQSSISLIYLNP